MSKELEAFKKVTISHEITAYKFNPYLDKNDDNYMVCINKNWEEELDIIKKALTRPTAEEVCKALSEYLSRGVKMYSDNTFYYTEQRQIGECDEIICGYGWENEHHTIAFEFDLPPHLITLIGRFYEGLENE